MSVKENKATSRPNEKQTAEHLSDTQSQQRGFTASSDDQFTVDGQRREPLDISSAVSLPAQAALLNDASFPIAQRQAIATRIGQIQGNHYLQRAIAKAGGNAPELSLPGVYIQRRPIRSAIGTALGTISIDSLPPTELRAQTEIVPSNARSGRFAGFEHRLEAQAAAWSQNTLCAIGEDRDGRFHVLNTGQAQRPPTSTIQIIPYARTLFSHLWWVDVPRERAQDTETSSGSWAQRAQHAKQWWDAWRLRTLPRDFPNGCQHNPQHTRTLEDLRRCLEFDFVVLLSEALGIDGSMIHVARSPQDREPNAVNFDLELQHAGGEGGIARLPTSRTGAIPQPSVAVGPMAFESTSRLSVLRTLVHEVTHFSHATRSIDLLERWRRSRSTQPFEEWLRRQRRARRISQVEYDLAIESSGGGQMVTQTLAFLEGFVTTYNRFPVTSTPTRFEQIDLIPNYWALSGHTTQDESIHRLAVLFRSLDAEHRSDFIDHARHRQATVHRNEFQLFWNRVVRDVLSQ